MFKSLVRVFTLFFSVLAYYLLSVNILDEKVVFGILIGVLTLYILYESLSLKSSKKYRWLIHPTLLCSLYYFLLKFGPTGVIFWTENDGGTTKSELINAVGGYEWVSYTMLMVIFACVSMWVGSTSKIAVNISGYLKNTKIINHFIRKKLNIRWVVVSIMIVVGVLARYASMSLGVYGYTGDNWVELAGYTRYLSIAGSASILALVVVSLYASSEEGKFGYYILSILLVLSVLLGVASGSKTRVIMPMVIVAVCFYVGRGVIYWRFVPLLIAGLVFAYSVVEPFRYIVKKDTRFRVEKAADIANVSYGIIRGDYKVPEYVYDRGDLLVTVAKRQNFTAIATKAIHYKEVDGLSSEDPKFLERVVLSPAYAVIPRLLWPDKPTATIGRWVTNKILEKPYLDSSTGMSVVAFLYFCGGIIAIILGFFVLGVIQSIWYNTFMFLGAGGVIVYICSLLTIVYPTNDYSSIIIWLIRFIPILIFIQYVVLRRE